MGVPLRGAVAGVAVALLGAGVLGLAAQQYTAQAHVAGPGVTRWHSGTPAVRLRVEHPSSLRDVRMTVDGIDLSSYARVDARGVVLSGVRMHDGWHQVHVQARDTGWFGGHIDRRFAILVDTTKPRLDLSTRGGYRRSSAVGGQTERGAFVTATWKGGRIAFVARKPAFTLSPRLAEGPATLRIVARDRVGNRTVHWLKLVVDRTRPAVDASAIAPLQRTSAPRLAGTIADRSPVRVVARFDGQSARLQLPATGRGAWTLPLPHVAEGLHRLKLTVTDAAGNVTTVRRSFVVDSTETLSDSETMQVGARGRDVAQLERRLDGEGFWHGPTTRIYDGRTVAAVKAFERAHAMVADGIAGPAVIAATSGRLVVKLHLFRVFFERAGKVVFSAPIAIGRPGFETPLGHWAITSKIKDPTWVPPNSPWAAGLEAIPPGAANPLGSRWIGTSAPNVGFHATNEPSSVGRPASHGCMRMYDADVRHLFDLVKVGMPVDIQP